MFPATERRLQGEWELLHQLAAVNPERLTNLSRNSGGFDLQLCRPGAVAVSGPGSPEYVTVHDLRFEFPVHFPAVPMELFLRIPVVHPNVSPETGFVCVWDRHRVSHTVELALHRLVAMLAGTLWNADAPHVMQPQAVACRPASDPAPLQGVAYEPVLPRVAAQLGGRRRRLDG